ncbi:hypothetical protein [Lachnoclostridium phytofermentans]|uniref:Lipoprotein n=1 Tax=Lachnoclostridium phytofermentans (strain ATCC 700394 / DSM 18823 / ISDg) TaxID=357809 RepID=A9KRU8_LACP7|nr:hypothetical protein [Lachnoclostridium phytofermentans]ABX43592.1 hypothetical protein Cphy_3238 [Lachnoclostridium phytofermentans ISDg]
MKKFIGSLTMMTLIILMFSSCGTKSEFQKEINATSKQSKSIENILNQLDINYNSDTVINTSNNDIVDGMDKAWEAYDLTNKDGSKYLLILRKSDKDFTAVLDSENKLLSGIIDNGILPKLFD